MTAFYKEYVLDRFKAWRQVGEKGTLVTVVGIVGASPRPLGSQMAVSESGEAVGLVTGGCAEAAIIAEAQAALREGKSRLVRYGIESPYPDIVLPCGSGLDLRFDPSPDEAILAGVQAALARREPSGLILPLNPEKPMAPTSVEMAEPVVRTADHLLRVYHPAMRLEVAGRGPIVLALAELAAQVGIQVRLISPDADLRHEAERSGLEASALTGPQAYDASDLDRASALVLMFHDHEWEPAILSRALESSAFYIGALGSKNTHETRLDVLRSIGVREAELERIHGPVGLDIGAEGPLEIALSVLAELVSARRAAGLPAL